MRTDNGTWGHCLAVALVACGLSLIAAPTLAHAAPCASGPADRVWEGDVSDDWFNPANWVPPSVPTQATHVCVPEPASRAPVIESPVGMHAQAASLESFHPISLNAGGLRLNSFVEPSVLHSDLVLRDGTSLGNQGALRIEGNLDWRRAMIFGAGSTTVAAGATVTSNLFGADRRLATQRLHLDGAGTFSGSGRTLLENGAEIEIGPGGSLDLQGDQRIDGAGLVEVEAGGSLARSVGSTPAIIGAALDNDGTVSAAAPSTIASPAFSLRGGSAGQSSSGTFLPSAGAVIDFAGPSTHTTSGARFAGAGVNSVSAGKVDAKGSTTVAAGATLALADSRFNADHMTVYGTLLWGDNSNLGGHTDISATGTLTASGCGVRTLDPGNSNGYLTIGGAATFNGSVGGCGSETRLHEAYVVVGPGGTLNLGGDQAIRDTYVGQHEPSIDVLPGGTLTHFGAGTAVIDAPFYNQGITRATAGRLMLAGENPTLGSSGGQFTAASGAVVDFHGLWHILESASFTGAGTIRHSEAYLFVHGTTSVAPETTFPVGANARLVVIGTLTVHGTFDWTGNSSIWGSGTTRIAPGGTMTATSCGGYRRLEEGTIRIDGAAGLPGAGSCSIGTAVSEGTLIEIGPGGVLNLGPGDSIGNGGGVAPEPLVHVLNGGTLSRIGGGPGDGAGIATRVTNDGTIDVATGSLSFPEPEGEGDFTNYDQSSGVLSGGSYVVRNGAKLRFAFADVRINAADVTLAGPGSGFVDSETGADGLENLQRIESGSALRLRDGRHLILARSLDNAGTIDLDGTTTLAPAGDYIQRRTATLSTAIAGPEMYGRLAAGGEATLDGRLTVNARHPIESADVLTGSSVTGRFRVVHPRGLIVEYLLDAVRVRQ